MPKEGNLKSYWEHRKSMKKNVEDHYRSETLPKSVINHVNHFLFFVRYARSGHSIIASMLDAHPNVVIAHEYALFVKWEHEPAQHSSRTWLFNTLTTTQGSVFTEDLGHSRLSRRAILLLYLGHGRGDTTLQLVFLFLWTSQGG